jgi:hypothetical protein
MRRPFDDLSISLSAKCLFRNRQGPVSGGNQERDLTIWCLQGLGASDCKVGLPKAANGSTAIRGWALRLMLWRVQSSVLQSDVPRRCRYKIEQGEEKKQQKKWVLGPDYTG